MLCGIGPLLTVQWGWWEEVVWRQHTDGQVADGKQEGRIPTRQQAGSSQARRPINELHFQGDLSESLVPSGSGAVWKATSSSWGPEPPPWPVSEPPRSLSPSPSQCLRPLRYPDISSETPLSASETNCYIHGEGAFIHSPGVPTA